jgi:adenine-specific DNA-methyltransferase
MLRTRVIAGILVSSTEKTPENPAQNICKQITAERIRLLNASTDAKYGNLFAEFAYLTMRTIAFEDLNYELKGDEIWTALEAMHDLPLTPFESGAAFQIHETDAMTLVYVDRFAPELVVQLQALGEAQRNVFVYAWAPGQLAPHLSALNIDVSPVRETLVKRFQQ